MKRFLDLFHNQNLRFQLTTWFLLISLIPLFWITFVTFTISKNIILKDAEDHLHVIGLKQINLLKTFFVEKERSASVLAKELIRPESEEALDIAIKKYGKQSPEYLNELMKIVPHLKEHDQSINYRNFILVDDDGMIVLSLNSGLIEPGVDLLKTRNPNEELFSELFKRTASTMKSQVSPLAFFNPNTMPTIFISAPLTRQNGKLFGVLIFQINNSTIYELVQNFHGVGNTGETLIAAELDSELVLFSSFFETNPYPHIYRISPKSSFGKFIEQVLAGTPSIQNVEDYHGKMTIAVGKKINPYTNWAIITKIDRNELLKTIEILKYLSWALLAITAIIVTIIASYVTRKLSAPLLLLTKKTKLMSEGDLSQRIHIPYHNEIGKLGQSFNEMASRLDDLIRNLDALVTKRTEEVQNKNTELNRTIEELKETQNRMIVQEKLASLGSLTAGIAHEIKNPLNFVTNFAELSFDIQKNLSANLEKITSLIPAEINEEFRDELTTLQTNLEKIVKHGKRADSIVHNMLQHSRGAPGEKTETDINKLLDEYTDLAFHGVRAKDTSFNVSIIKNFKVDLPKINISPQEISRVFLNLLNNAFYAVNQRKKTADSSYKPTVELITDTQDNQVIIKFRDNGTGIPEEVLAKLFTPFFTTKPAGEGTGLGLSLSYNIIVKGHGGTLTAESEVDRFTQFTVSIPIKNEK